MMMFKRTVRAIAAVGIVFIGLSAVKADNISSTIRSVTKENSVDSASSNISFNAAADVDRKLAPKAGKDAKSSKKDKKKAKEKKHAKKKKDSKKNPMLPDWCSAEAFEGDFSYISPCEGRKSVRISCEGVDCTWHEAKFDLDETGEPLQDVCAVSGKFSKDHFEVPDDDSTSCVLQYFDLTNDLCGLYEPRGLGLKAQIIPSDDADRFDILFSWDSGQSYYNEDDMFGPREAIRDSPPGFGPGFDASFPSVDGGRELLEGMDIEAIRQHRRLDNDCYDSTVTQVEKLILDLEAAVAQAQGTVF